MDGVGPGSQVAISTLNRSVPLLDTLVYDVMVLILIYTHSRYLLGSIYLINNGFGLHTAHTANTAQTSHTAHTAHTAHAAHTAASFTYMISGQFCCLLVQSLNC
jgi:hypothetical protein